MSFLLMLLDVVEVVCWLMADVFYHPVLLQVPPAHTVSSGASNSLVSPACSPTLYPACGSALIGNLL
jgi:hypothetical protein